jgi:hypothetical protein
MGPKGPSFAEKRVKMTQYAASLDLFLSVCHKEVLHLYALPSPSLNCAGRGTFFLK